MSDSKNAAEPQVTSVLLMLRLPPHTHQVWSFLWFYSCQNFTLFLTHLLLMDQRLLPKGGPEGGTADGLNERAEPGQSGFDSDRSVHDS